MALFPNSFLNFIAILAFCFTLFMCVYIVVTKGEQPGARKLKRMAKELYECSREPKCCNCEHYAGEDAICGRRFEERLREMGIEVEDE